MASSTLGFFILSITLFVAEAYFEDGRSDLCLLGILDPVRHTSPSEQCCGEEGICEDWLKPNETKHGLTNPDGKWSRRLCSCDKTFYHCVTKDLSPTDKDWVRRTQFWDLKCFEKMAYHYVNGRFHEEKYVFRRLLDTIREYE